MPAVDESQRRLFAIAEHHPGEVYARNRGLAKLPHQTLHDFAATKGLGGNMADKPKLGTGARFAALKEQLSHRPGVTNPGALAGYIGRKKYGAHKMAQMSEANRGK